MNILVTYFSQTGNTEKIARVIHEEASAISSSILKKIDETGPSSLDDFDLVFIGSPCHAGTLAAPVRELLSLIPDKPRFHLSGFLTHASSAYKKSDYENCFTFFSSLCKKKGILYHGCYECQGYLVPNLHEFIKKSKKIPDDEWARMVDAMNGHPDSNDLAHARTFAKNVIDEMKR